MLRAPEAEGRLQVGVFPREGQGQGRLTLLLATLQPTPTFS